MNFLSGIIPTLIVLGLLIVIHEFGHFIACRLSGVKVEKFSIGFGPEILKWKGRETTYVLSLLPFGGYVKPQGESASEVTAAGGNRPGDYMAASLWKRIFIVCAGVIMNYILAYVLFVALFMIGRPIPGTTIGALMKGYPAEASGLKIGDKILSVEGQTVKTWNEMTAVVEKAEGPVELQLLRAGAPMWLQVTPKEETLKNIFSENVTLKIMGIRPGSQSDQYEKFGLLESLAHAAQAEIFLTALTHKAIFYLCMGKLSMQMISGPIGIVAATGSAAQMGFVYLLQLAANLSVSLAVINLIPIPGLDGGHLFFLLIEAVRRKQVSVVAQERLTQAGFALLMVFAVFVIYNDLVKLDVFEKVLGLFTRATESQVVSRP